jgi:RimJ/RimL family protein N-acetyltransferase
MLRFPDPPLSDGTITLRAKTRDDVEALVAACQDPEISRWTRVPSPYTRDDAEGWIAASELELAAGSAIGWLVVDADGALLGSVGVQNIRPEEGVAEIGYWVAAAARGRGVAARAVRLVTGWALREGVARTLEITVHEDNPASQAVARAAGFALTGERDEAPAAGSPPGRHLVFSAPA